LLQSKERWKQNQNQKMKNTQILHATKLHARKKRSPGSHQTLIQTNLKTRRFPLFHKLKRADSFHERIGAFLSGRLTDFFIFENRGYIPSKIGSSNVVRNSPV
jgi:hypothetical protein